MSPEELTEVVQGVMAAIQPTLANIVATLTDEMDTKLLAQTRTLEGWTTQAITTAISAARPALTTSSKQNRTDEMMEMENVTRSATEVEHGPSILFPVNVRVGGDAARRAYGESLILMLQTSGRATNITYRDAVIADMRALLSALHKNEAALSLINTWRLGCEKDLTTYALNKELFGKAVSVLYRITEDYSHSGPNLVDRTKAEYMKTLVSAGQPVWDASSYTNVYEGVVAQCKAAKEKK